MRAYTFSETFNLRLIKEILIISILALILGFSFNAARPNPMELFLNYETNDSKQKCEKISVEKASVILESEMIILLDLRSADNFHSAHIPAALNFPFENIYEQLPELEKLLNPKDSLIIIYGSDLMDTRPDDFAELIGMMGYTNLKIIIGGWASWVAKDFPVTTFQNSEE